MNQEYNVTARSMITLQCDIIYRAETSFERSQVQLRQIVCILQEICVYDLSCRSTQRVEHVSKKGLLAPTETADILAR